MFSVSVFVGENYFSIPEETTRIKKGVSTSAFGEFVVKDNELTFSPKGGLEPVTISNENQGWFTFENGSFVSDWKLNTINAFGFLNPKNLLQNVATLSTHLFDDTKDVKVGNSCRYTYSLKEPEKIKSIEVADSCTPAQLEKLLAKFVLKDKEDFGTSRFEGFVAAYWSFPEAKKFIIKLFKRYLVEEFNCWQATSNTHLEFKCNTLSTSSKYDHVAISRSSEDCGISIILNEKNAAYGQCNEPIYPFSLVPHTTRDWQELVLRALSMLLERHGWKVFETLLTPRHFETMEVFDKGPRAFAKLMVERYGIEHVPSGVESLRYFILRKVNGKDSGNKHDNVMDKRKLLLHRVDLQTAYSLWGESFWKEIIAAASVSDLCWIDIQKVHSRIFQSSDGVLICRNKTEEYPIAESNRMILLQAGSFLDSDNLVTRKNSNNEGKDWKLKGFLSPPISAPAFLESEVVNGFAFRPKISSVVVALLEWERSHEVRAIRLFADGSIKPIKLNDTKLRFSFASSHGACLMSEADDVAQTEEPGVEPEVAAPTTPAETAKS